MHRAALATAVAAAPACQLRHDAARFHAGGQHVAMVAIAGDHLITRL